MSNTSDAVPDEPYLNERWLSVYRWQTLPQRQTAMMLLGMNPTSMLNASVPVGSKPYLNLKCLRCCLGQTLNTSDAAWDETYLNARYLSVCSWQTYLNAKCLSACRANPPSLSKASDSAWGKPYLNAKHLSAC